MTVQWLDNHTENTTLSYRLTGDEVWQKVDAAAKVLQADPRYKIFAAELTNLKSDSAYEFVIDEKVHRFHTMPDALEKPISFVVGGDTYPDAIEIFKNTCLQAAKTNPAFVLIGGDIAYTSITPTPHIEKTHRWIEWLIAWSECMVKENGELIPFMPALGNHDVVGHFLLKPNARSFFTLFAFPGRPGYNALDFSDYLSLIVLDSEHLNPILGNQTEWLEKTLAERESVAHKFAIYHVPAYPCVRKFEGVISILVRHAWCPLFSRYGLTAAFEHHDHAYKRTSLINGVLYLGDGGWGTGNTRQPSPRWYTEKIASVRHFIHVTLNPDGSRQFVAINDQGEPFDQVSLP